MRARSYKYPDHDHYIDTTYYDEVEEYLDVGFQRLKTFNVTLYPELSLIKKLFIDHNDLKHLPDRAHLPQLRELTCSYNKLVAIPFYPDLTFLNISHNYITNLHNYHNSRLRYLDCSNNNFIFNISLPHCRQLYITHNRLESIDLTLIPRLELLDCDYNNLRHITTSQNLIELSIQNNQMRELPAFPKLTQLNADNNFLTTLVHCSSLVTIHACHNRLTVIENKPFLSKLIAHHNDITEVKRCPMLKIVDLSHNRLTQFPFSHVATDVSLQFNPINTINLDAALKSLRRLQINHKTYKNIYNSYNIYFTSIEIKIDAVKLEQSLKKLNNVFNDKMIHYLVNRFYKIQFKDREVALFKISLKFYYNYFSTSNVTTVSELIELPEFQQLVKSMKKLYYKTVIVIIGFGDG